MSYACDTYPLEELRRRYERRERGGWERGGSQNGREAASSTANLKRVLPQGSVEAAAESRRCEAETAKLLAKEAAEIKKNLGEGGGKQRDVSHFPSCHMYH